MAILWGFISFSAFLPLVALSPFSSAVPPPPPLSSSSFVTAGQRWPPRDLGADLCTFSESIAVLHFLFLGID